MIAVTILILAAAAIFAAFVVVYRIGHRIVLSVDELIAALGRFRMAAIIAAEANP